MSEKIADYVESLIDEFVDIADDFSTDSVLMKKALAPLLIIPLRK